MVGSKSKKNSSTSKTSKKSSTKTSQIGKKTSNNIETIRDEKTGQQKKPSYSKSQPSNMIKEEPLRIMKLKSRAKGKESEKEKERKNRKKEKSNSSDPDSYKESSLSGENESTSSSIMQPESTSTPLSSNKEIQVKTVKNKAASKTNRNLKSKNSKLKIVMQNSEEASNKFSEGSSESNVNTDSRNSISTARANRSNKKRLDTEDKKLIEQNAKPIVDLKDRRLDSLARLLEGKGICAAVYYNNDRIFIASNKLKELKSDRKRSKLNETEELINNVIKYYSKWIEAYSKNKKEEIHLLRKKLKEDRIKIFNDICISYIKGQMQKAYPKGCEDFIASFTKKILLYASDPLKIVCDLEFQNFAFEQLNNIQKNQPDMHRGMLFGGSIAVIPRLSRDFRKLERYFVSVEGKDINMKYSFIKQGSKLHAEMQIIEELFTKDENKSLYIGISKLCCLDCFATIMAINFKKINLEKDTEKVEYLEISMRGAHNLKKDKNWEVPKFLREDDELKRLYDQIKQCISLMKEQVNDKSHISMMPTNSDSPTGTPVATDEEPLKNKFVNSKEVAEKYVSKHSSKIDKSSRRNRDS